MANPVPFTIRGNPAPPTATKFGVNEVIVGTRLLTVNVTAFDDPPPGAGVKTVMFAVPAVVKLLAGIVAVNCVALAKAVAKSVLLKRTTEVLMKLLPLTMRATLLLPTFAEVGL